MRQRRGPSQTWLRATATRAAPRTLSDLAVGTATISCRIVGKLRHRNSISGAARSGRKHGTVVSGRRAPVMSTSCMRNQRENELMHSDSVNEKFNVESSMCRLHLRGNATPNGLAHVFDVNHLLNRLTLYQRSKSRDNLKLAVRKTVVRSSGNITRTSRISRY